MSLITQKEVLKIARMAHIQLTEEEVAKMQSHLEAVLSYAARVQDMSSFAKATEDIAKDDDLSTQATENRLAKTDAMRKKNINVEREDLVIPCNAEPILVQSPVREGDYFVVPVIIETTQ